MLNKVNIMHKPTKMVGFVENKKKYVEFKIKNTIRYSNHNRNIIRKLYTDIPLFVSFKKGPNNGPNIVFILAAMGAAYFTTKIFTSEKKL